MKKLILGLTVMLTACASTNGTMNANGVMNTANQIGTAIFQEAVNQKCQSEIKQNQYYQMASLIINEEQRTKIVGKVCGCVSQKAPESVSLGEIATATINPNARPQIVTKAVVGTLQACVSEFIH